MLKNNRFFNLTYLKKLGKLSFFSILILLLLLILAAGGYLLWFKFFRQVPPPQQQIADISPYLRHGDVIMRSGVGLWSKLFCDYNQHDKRFSHVGIIVKKDGKFWVLHSEGDDISGRGNVHYEKLENFIALSQKIGISRLHTLDSNLLVENAKKYYGHIFDWKFDRKESIRIYCTELIDLALRQIPGGETGLAVSKNDIIPVDSCLDRRYFTEIPLRNTK